MLRKDAELEHMILHSVMQTVDIILIYKLKIMQNVLADNIFKIWVVLADLSKKVQEPSKLHVHCEITFHVLQNLLQFLI